MKVNLLKLDLKNKSSPTDVAVIEHRPLNKEVRA